LRFFGHIERIAPKENDHRAANYTSQRLTGNDPKEDPITQDSQRSSLRPLNISPSYVWKKASSREHWRSPVVDTATRKKSMP